MGLKAANAQRRGVVAAQGFTLLEVMISTLLTTILIGGLVTVLGGSQRAFEGVMDKTSMRQQARLTIGRMGSELRLAGFGIDNAGEALTIASASRIQFVADIDDGSALEPCDASFEDAVNGGAERVTYELRAGLMWRVIDCWGGLSWAIMAGGESMVGGEKTTGAAFRFFDAVGAELMVPAGGALSLAQRATVTAVEFSLDLPKTPNGEGMPDPSSPDAGANQVNGVVRLRNR